MYAQKLETLPPPPGVLGSLKAGFEAVSSHVILISLPFLLDLFLWLGPRMAVNELLGPVYAASFRQIQGSMGSPGAGATDGFPPGPVHGVAAKL